MPGPVGHRVVGLDFDSSTVKRLSEGIPPLFEVGLEALVQQGLSTGNLSFATGVRVAVQAIDLLWIAYDTPVDDDDHADFFWAATGIGAESATTRNGGRTRNSQEMAK